MPETASNLPPEFAALARHAAVARQRHLTELFAADSARFDKFSLEAAGLFLDFSKNQVDDATLGALLDFARQRAVEARRDAMFRGEHVNTTEQRAALHVALRAQPGESFPLDGHDVVPQVQAVLERMAAFSLAVREGSWRGHRGEAITDVVNIGIGGSHLGPAMACAALRPFARKGPRLHFLSNVDGHEIDALLEGLDAGRTLFIVASKTFTTQETMLNASAARSWFLQRGKESDLAKHFVAVSTNAAAVNQFGIDTANMFPFWDWVGGRYSVWSAIGLPLMLAIGDEHFRAFLAGAHAMDRHFREAPPERNMPLLLALVGFWNRQFLGAGSLLAAPYHQDLHLFPAWLQQLDMESNGKSVTTDGMPVEWPTAPVIWGSTGTNGQHAYFQLLHQGTNTVPVDFIAALQPDHERPELHRSLLANCFAQSEALMHGKDAAAVRAELQAKQTPADRIEALLPHRVCPGNQPSNTILLERLDPPSLGALLALYEHKTFVQGVLWKVNSFDQWGVELGKVLAGHIRTELEGGAAGMHDSSTAGLIARTKASWTPSH